MYFKHQLNDIKWHNYDHYFNIKIILYLMLNMCDHKFYFIQCRRCVDVTTSSSNLTIPILNQFEIL